MVQTASVSNKEAWYQKTSQQLYPNDYRAYNNLGMLACIKKGDLSAAENAISNKAKSLKGNAGEVNANLALVALNKGNVKDAEAYMGKASGADGFNEANAAEYCQGFLSAGCQCG